MQPGNPGQDPYGEQPQYGQQPTSGQPYGQQPTPGQDPYAQQPSSGQPYGQPGAHPQQQYPAAYGAPATGQANNTMGLVSMILGIVSIPLLCCFYLGIPLGIGAVVVGFIGKGKAERGEATNRGQAMTGIICGGIAAALGIILVILSLVFDVGSYNYNFNNN